MFKVGGKPHEPIITLVVIGQQVPMEVDTGAAVSVISTMTLANLFHTGPLSSTSTILTTYTGDPMPFGGRDESRGQLWGTECKVVSVCQW